MVKPMNARKRRKGEQAKETDRLGPKGKQSGLSGVVSLDANNSTVGVESEPKSSIVVDLEHGKAASLASAQLRQTSPQGVSGGAALRGPKKPMPVCNAPDMPTSVWWFIARKRSIHHTGRNANDGCASNCCVFWHELRLASGDCP